MAVRVFRQIHRLRQLYQNRNSIEATRVVVEFLGSKITAVLFGTNERKIGIYNKVAVRNDRLLAARDVHEEYEDSLIYNIRNQVEPGDDVVVVGGGLGVSSVTSARIAGEDGTVITYEAGAEQFEKMAETIEINGVSDRVRPHHAIVQCAERVIGTTGDPETVPAVDLPECDVLISDCEGAEINIIPELEPPPPTLIVETHGYLGAPTEDVCDLLEDRGYEIEHEIAEFAERDIYIIVAKFK